MNKAVVRNLYFCTTLWFKFGFWYCYRVIPCQLFQSLNPPSQIFRKFNKQIKLSCWSYQQTKFFWNWLRNREVMDHTKWLLFVVNEV